MCQCCTVADKILRCSCLGCRECVYMCVCLKRLTLICHILVCESQSILHISAPANTQYKSAKDSQKQWYGKISVVGIATYTYLVLLRARRCYKHFIHTYSFKYTHNSLRKWRLRGGGLNNLMTECVNSGKECELQSLALKFTFFYIVLLLFEKNNKNLIDIYW